MKREIKWAVIISVLMLAWLTLLKYTGFESEKAEMFPLVSMIYFVIMFGLYLLAIRERRSINKGYISRRDAFLTGLLITLFLVVLSPFNMLIFNYLINPDFFDTMINLAVEKGEPIQQAESDFNITSYIFSSMLMMGVLGGLFSALGAVILQKLPSKFENNEPLA
jgi:hypothetical protein